MQVSLAINEKLSRTIIVSVIFLLSTWEAAVYAQTIQRVGGSGAKEAVSSSGPQGTQYMLGVNGILLKNATTQKGEQLGGGTTLLTQTNLQINFTDWLLGVGVIYQSDQLGGFQKNTGTALKAEFTWLGYYFDVAYGTSSQSFTNRAVKSREGTQMIYSTGFRVPAIFSFVYFDAGIRNRKSVYTKQDGQKMASPLTETTITPFIGFGISI